MSRCSAASLRVWGRSNRCLCVLSHFSRVQCFVTLWTVAGQSPHSMGFSRQEYWSWLPCPPPGDLPDPWIELTSLMSAVLAGEFFTTSVTWEAPNSVYKGLIGKQEVQERVDMRVRDNSHNDEQVSKDSDQVHGEKQLKYEGLQFWFREGTGTPRQYSCLENPMDGGAYQAAVHGVAKSRTGLRDFTFTFHFHALEKEMATHSSVLAWRIPGTGSLVGCCLWGRTESDTNEAI